MIVRDLPDIELIRAGIRHHHERWDGDGYLDRLDGRGDPADRPHPRGRRRVLGDDDDPAVSQGAAVEEALRRLEDAAGTQLDERLVAAFIDGIETAADPPLPGEEVSSRLWTPRAVA